jgi:hypothetical protein
MTQDYVQEKAQRALIATQGEEDAAQKLLVAWAVRDQTLLLGLAKAHLKMLAKIALEQAAQNMVNPPLGAEPLPDGVLNRLMNQVGVRRSPDNQDMTEMSVLDPVRQAQTWQAIAESFKKKS